MAAPKSLTQACMQLGDVPEAMSDVASQHSSGSGSSSSGSRSGASSVARSLHDAIHEAISSPLRQTSAPFDDVPQQPFEDPIPQPVVEGEALPKPFSPQQSPLPPAPKPVQRPSAKQDAVIKTITTAPEPVVPPRTTDAPVKTEAVETGPASDGNTDRNRQLMTYVLIPTLAFVATYFGGPLVAPGLFQNKLTGEQDSKKAFIAATLTACGSILAARCVL